ncbi:MAG: hypothetical protein FVQ81_18200, partial [Candidatus Glassbacteria bacterium]|nr:hypothetical protein [Candidatus Glassbacteria bacterium]
MMAWSRPATATRCANVSNRSCPSKKDWPARNMDSRVRREKSRRTLFVAYRAGFIQLSAAMEKLFEQLLQMISKGRACALCSVLASSGSVPAPAGCRLLVHEDGTIAGTVGGGALEGEVTHDARRAISAGAPLIRTFDFTGEEMVESLQICGGKITVYTEVIFPTALERLVAETILQKIREGRSVALATAVLDSYDRTPPAGHRMAFDRDGVLAGSLAVGDLNDLVIRKALPSFDGNDPIYLELERAPAEFAALQGFLVDFIQPAPTLVVFGGGHIGRPLAHLGALCGFRVVVADDRAEFVSPERFPDAERLLSGPYPGIFDQLDIGPRHYLVSVTRCHTTDRQVLERAVRTPAAYLGMIGSRRKV